MQNYPQQKIALTALTLAISSIVLTACGKAEKSASPSSPAEAVSPVIVAPMPAPMSAEDVSVSSNSMAKNSASSAMMLEKRSGKVAPPHLPPQNTEKYQDKKPNPIHQTATDAIATLSIDTDTGSYANTRRFLNDGQLPPANLVFLVDVSGSMSDKDKLELAKSSLKMLTQQLRPQDTISLVTYAGNTEIALPATSGSDKAKILAAIDKLNSGGSTNGEAAIKLAYQQARANFKKDGINRILMLTDGDFNVGVSNVDEMLDIIRRERDTGVSLSTFGFGEGNLNDHMMEQVADNGNGNYSYIDSLSEAKKALIDEMSSTFNTVAKDVKIQVEFNPATVKEWRLIGYENRILKTEDFNNDKIDAGDLGAGKSVVALFEVTPVGQKGWIDDSRYTATTPKATAKANELGYLKIRYKAPTATTSQLLEVPISKQTTAPSSELQFAMAVAGFGEKLSQSQYVGDWSFANSKQLAQAGLGNDPQGIRHEFVKLVELAGALQPTVK